MMVQILKPVLSFAVISSLVFSGVSTCFAGSQIGDDEMEIGSASSKSSGLDLSDNDQIKHFKGCHVLWEDLINVLQSSKSSITFSGVTFEKGDSSNLWFNNRQLSAVVVFKNLDLDPALPIIEAMINTGRNKNHPGTMIDLSEGNTMSQDNRMYLLNLVDEQKLDFRKNAMAGPVIKWFFNPDDETLTMSEVSKIRGLLAWPKRELCDFKLSVTNKELLDAQDRLTKNQSILKQIIYLLLDRQFQSVFGTKSKGYERSCIIGTSIVSTFVIIAILTAIFECVLLNPDSCDL